MNAQYLTSAELSIRQTEPRPMLVKKFDYIQNPKPDGYRGIHLIMKYFSNSQKAFNDQKIEIQVRSKSQHAWATAVETCQTFTGQSLKSKVKSADEKWLRFFALMSSAIAAREKKPIVPGTPESTDDRIAELRRIDNEENILTILSGWNNAIHYSEVQAKNAHVFL